MGRIGALEVLPITFHYIHCSCFVMMTKIIFFSGRIPCSLSLSRLPICWERWNWRSRCAQKNEKIINMEWMSKPWTINMVIMRKMLEQQYRVLCISTSYWVPHTNKSWSKFKFLLFSTFFDDKKDFLRVIHLTKSRWLNEKTKIGEHDQKI